MSRKIFRKRMISIVLVLYMLIGSTSLVQAVELVQPLTQPVITESLQDETTPATMETNQVGMEVTLRFDAYGYTKVYPVKVQLPGKYRSLDQSVVDGGYGLELNGLSDPGYYTPLHAMAQYCLDKGLVPNNEIILNTNYQSLNVSNFLQSWTAHTFMMFFVNNSSNGNDVLGSYRLDNGDYVTLADWYYSTNSDLIYFETEHYESSAGDAFDIQLHGMTDLWTAYSAENAQIIVLDEYGDSIDNTENLIYEAGSTNANGTAFVQIKQPGTYILAAVRINEQGYHEINRGYALVKVNPALALTDGEAVEKAKEQLTLGDVSAITSSISLPVVGNYGTALTWSSSNPSLVNGTGTLIERPCDENMQVTLTAQISKGSATVEKEFVVTVKGSSLELKTLSVSPGTLSFEAGKNDYTIYVPIGTTSVQVTYATEENDVVIINGIKTTGATISKMETVSIQDGSTITLSVKNERYNKEKNTTLTIWYGNPAGPLPNLPDEWGQYLGNDRNNAVTSAPTPIDQVDLAWKSKSESTTGFSISGTPLLINGNIYVARVDELQMLDIKTGAIIKKVALHSNLAWYSYLAYGDGKVFVPLGNGSVQAFDPTTLESLFVTEVPDLGMQGVCAVYYKNGMIFVGTTNGSEPDKSRGVYTAYNSIDLFKEQTNEVIKPVWKHTGKGFYGSGAVSVNKNEQSLLLYAGDDGMVQCVNPTDGSLVSSTQLVGAVRSPLVEDSGYVWTTTKAGKLYKLAINGVGVVSIVAETDLPQSTTNAPVVTGGKVYVTGGEAEKGYFSIYDMELTLLAQKLTEGRMNAPTVATSHSDTYVYFTEYNKPGGLYMAKVTGSNNIITERLFLPKDQNYCMSNVVVGGDGVIYFGNDSGHLFAVRSGKGGVPDVGDGESGEKPKPKPDPIPDSSSTHNPSLSVEPTLPQLKSFMPTKRTMIVSTKKEEKVKTESEIIVESITEHISSKQSSLTVKNVPNVVEATVFETLKKNPNFKLILDCGKYTISMRGSDVVNSKSSLHTKIIEKEGALAKKEQEAIGNYQMFELESQESLPGKLTVVYPLPEKLLKATGLYFYEGDDLQHASEAVIQKHYVMFYLNKAGDFLLSDTTPQTVNGIVSNDIDNREMESRSTVIQGRIPISIQALLAAVGGLIVGGMLTGIIMTRKRKKNSTWEE